MLAGKFPTDCCMVGLTLILICSACAALGPSPAVLTDPSAAARLRELHRLATERYARIDSYIVRLRVRESIKGVDKPEETMLVSFRKTPLGISLRWLDPGHKGLVIIFRGPPVNKLHVHLSSGERLVLAPDGFLVRAFCRYPIGETGFGGLISHFERHLIDSERGVLRCDLRYLGVRKRPEFDVPLETVEQVFPPRLEKLLPEGGRRHWFFDPESHLPVMVVTWDAAGKEIEYCCYDRLQYPVGLDDHDFDPDGLQESKGVADPQDGFTGVPESRKLFASPGRLTRSPAPTGWRSEPAGCHRQGPVSAESGPGKFRRS